MYDRTDSTEGCNLRNEEQALLGDLAVHVCEALHVFVAKQHASVKSNGQRTFNEMTDYTVLMFALTTALEAQAEETNAMRSLLKGILGAKARMADKKIDEAEATPEQKRAATAAAKALLRKVQS